MPTIGPTAKRRAAAPRPSIGPARLPTRTGVSSQPIYPNLAGQYRNYLVHALKEYRSGQRKNAIMAAQAKDLTEADIKALAAYYAAQPGPLYTPSVHTPPKK